MPPTVEVFVEGARANFAQAILFGKVFYFNDNVVHAGQLEV
jgi:hypothetical protein